MTTPGCLPSQFSNVPDAFTTDLRETIPASFWILPRQEIAARQDPGWDRQTEEEKQTHCS